MYSGILEFIIFLFSCRLNAVLRCIAMGYRAKSRYRGRSRRGFTRRGRSFGGRRFGGGTTRRARFGRRFGRGRLRLRRGVSTGQYYRQLIECDFGDTPITFTNNPSGAGGVGGALTIFAGMVADWASLAATWQMYRINKVHVRFIPFTDNRNTTVAGGPSLPSLWGGGLYELLTVLDFNDALVPTSRAALVEQSAYLRKTRGGVHRRSFRPSLVSTQTFPTSGSPVALNQMVTNSSMRWLPVANPNVPHYGVKWWLDGTPPASWSGEVIPTCYTVQVMLDITFMNRA